MDRFIFGDVIRTMRKIVFIYDIFRDVLVRVYEMYK